MSEQIKSAKELVEKAFNQAQKVIDAPVSLHIWGGSFNDTKQLLNTAQNNSDEAIEQSGNFNDTKQSLNTFLNAWDDEKSPKFQFSMVEHVNHFRANTANLKAIIQQADLTERIRLFGEDGDLDIRRDGNTIHWRFISEEETKLPDLSNFGAEPYPADSEFAKDVQTYLLWRRDKHEQRVKHKWAEGVDFTHLKQVQYLRNGRVAFVRYVAFEERDHNE